METAANALTEDQLRAAWSDRRRYGWPHDFESSMEHPLLARIIRMHALHVLKGTERRVVRQSSPPPDYPQQDRLIEPTPRRFLDGKSLASGEKPDED